MSQTDETKKSDQLVVSMKVLKQCKHSVRYIAIGGFDQTALESIYLNRDAYNALEKPEIIVVMISPGVEEQSEGKVK